MEFFAKQVQIVVIATLILNAAGDSDGRTRAASSGRSLRQSPPSIGDGWHSTYHDYDQITERLVALATHYSELVSLRTMKRMTVQNREIAYMRIGGYFDNSKRVVIVGLQHAREWLAASMTMYIIERLLTGYQSNDEELRLFLDNYQLIVIPVLNPDGLQYTFSDRYLGDAAGPCTVQEQSQGSCNRMWRKNRQHVVDGQACTGIDLNRAWPVDWGMRGGEAVSTRPCAEDYAGEHPFQAEEALALCELLAELHGTSEQQLCYNVTSSRAEGGWSSTSGLPSQGIVGLLDFHAYGQLILGSWAHLNLQTNNKAIVTSIGMAMQEAANEGCKSSECMWSYGIGDLGGEIYLTSGTLPDWAHWAFGAASFTVELPPRTQAQGGFAPSENLVQYYTAKSFPIVTAYLSGLQQDTPTPVSETSISADLACRGGINEKLDLEVANILDHYPRELSWEVVDASSMDRLAGWDANYGGVRPGEDFAIGGQMMLCRGVYIVVIRDSNGDGSCCEYGQGATSVISKGKILFKGDGTYGTGQVLLVRLDDTDPLVVTMDPSLYPMSEELLETISAMQNEESPDAFWSSLDAIRARQPSSGLSSLEIGLVATGSAAAAAVLFLCTRMLVRQVLLRRETKILQEDI